MKTYERPQVFCQEDLCEGCPADNGSFCTLTKDIQPVIKTTVLPGNAMARVRIK